MCWVYYNTVERQYNKSEVRDMNRYEAMQLFADSKTTAIEECNGREIIERWVK